uniref:Uncharacterized protein n=1 Tax=Solibacter usitatus (strain Ellin6076) TaxID=234267 RepID=Q01ZG1_SOLUE
MENTTLEHTDDYAVMLDLGAALGQNHAFGLVAGRCSAAQAAMLQRLRQEKKYLLCSANWREFCTDFLRISGSEANRLIGLWEEFGPEYFEIAQLMRISPESYRAIAPAVKDGALHHNGEAIEFDQQNSRRLATAVSELRNTRQKKPKPQLPMHERIAHLDRRCSWIIAEFEEISRKESAGENWLQFTSVLTRVRTELARIEAENGL